MSNGKAYDDLIMDHIKNARGYYALDNATHNANGSNPLCGDEMTVYLRVDDGHIEDVSFQCTCCGISMASASIMAASVKGKPVTEAKAYLQGLIASLNARNDPLLHTTDPREHALLKTVQEFPTRTSCATLPWITLDAAMDNRQDTVLVK